MNRIILLSFCLILVSGCGAVQQAQLNTGMQKANEISQSCDLQATPPEIARAWKMAMQEVKKLCPLGSDTNPLPPSKSIEANECWAEQIEKYVTPVETNIKALNALLASNRQIAKQYQNGKLDRSAANSQREMADKKYTLDHISFYKQAQCKNSALQQYVMPNYPHKGLLMSFMTRQSEVGLAIDNGQMTPEKGDIEIQKAWAAFANNEQQTMMQIQAQNAQRSSAMMAAGADLLKGPPQPRMQHTNCSLGLDGRSMNCTTH